MAALDNYGGFWGTRLYQMPGTWLWGDESRGATTDEEPERGGGWALKRFV